MRHLEVTFSDCIVTDVHLDISLLCAPGALPAVIFMADISCEPLPRVWIMSKTRALGGSFLHPLYTAAPSNSFFQVAVNLLQCFGWRHQMVFVHGIQSQIPFSISRSKSATVYAKFSCLMLSIPEPHSLHCLKNVFAFQTDPKPFW